VNKKGINFLSSELIYKFDKEFSMDHLRFWWEFVGKVGAPIFAATLVACLLSGKVYLLHIILLMMGLGMMVLSHWHDYHGEGHSGRP
jgi:hypothetical protein